MVLEYMWYGATLTMCINDRFEPYIRSLRTYAGLRRGILYRRNVLQSCRPVRVGN